MGRHVAQPVQSVVAVIVAFARLGVGCPATDVPLVGHLEDVVAIDAVVVRMAVGVGIVVAQVFLVGLGIVCILAAEVLAGLLAVVAAVDAKDEIVAPFEFLGPKQLPVEVQRAVAVEPRILHAVDDMVAIRRVLTGRVPMSIGVGHIYSGHQVEGLVQLEGVVGREAEVLLPAGGRRATEDVAFAGKGLAGGARPEVVVAPFHHRAQFLLVVLVAVLGGQVHAYLLGSPQSRRHVGRRPFAFAARLAVLVHVVHIAKERHPRVVVVVEREQACHVAFFRAKASLDVGQISAVVFALQADVHHVVFLLHVVAYHLALLGRLVVDLDVLDGEVGQVVEHHLVVALEEVLAVECQVVYLLAVDVDVAVVLEFGSRHLSDESVEHRSFRQVEGRGIVDDGVAAIGYLHLGARDDHLVERALAVDAVVLFLFHQQSWQFEVVVA